MTESKDKQSNDPKQTSDPKSAPTHERPGKSQRDDQPLKKMNDDPDEDKRSEH